MIRPNLTNQPYVNRNSKYFTADTTADKKVHVVGNLDDSSAPIGSIGCKTDKDKTYIYSCRVDVVSGTYTDNRVYSLTQKRSAFLNNVEGTNLYYIVIKDLEEPNGLYFYFSNMKGTEGYMYDFKLEEVKEGESEQPTDFCLSIEDIAKLNTEMAKYCDGTFVRPNIRKFDSIYQSNNSIKLHDFTIEKRESDKSFTYTIVDTGKERKWISTYDDTFNSKKKKMIVSFNVAFINFDIEKITYPDNLKKLGDRYYYTTNKERPLYIYTKDLPVGSKLIIDHIKFEEVKEGELELPTAYCLAEGEK